MFPSMKIRLLGFEFSMHAPFSSPELSILQACGRNRKALGATISGMRHRCSLRETGWAEFGYFLCYSKWLLPELSIPAAGQKDRRLWGRECAAHENVPFLCMLKCSLWNISVSYLKKQRKRNDHLKGKERKKAVNE